MSWTRRLYQPLARSIDVVERALDRGPEACPVSARLCERVAQQRRGRSRSAASTRPHGGAERVLGARDQVVVIRAVGGRRERVESVSANVREGMYDGFRGPLKIFPGGLIRARRRQCE